MRRSRTRHRTRTVRRAAAAGSPLSAVVIVAAVLVYLWRTAGRVSTDDAQVDGHITQVSARVGGTVTKVNVKENQYVEAGTVLVELDPRDYQVAVDRARAELADAQANASGAATGIPLTQVSSRDRRAHRDGRRGGGAGGSRGGGSPGRSRARAARRRAGTPTREGGDGGQGRPRTSSA